MGPAIVPILTTVVGAALSFGLQQAFKPKAISAPTSVSQFTLSADQQNAVNAAISQDSQLSTQANAAAQSAIQQYQSGTLSASDQAAYEQATQQQLQQVQQSLASAGFTEGSTQWQSAMSQFQTWSQALKGQYLTTALNNGLQEAGVSSNAVANINSIISTESGISQGNNQGILGAGYVNAQNNQTNTALGNAIGKGVGAVTGSTEVNNGIAGVLGLPQQGTKTSTQAQGLSQQVIPDNSGGAGGAASGGETLSIGDVVTGP